MEKRKPGPKAAQYPPKTCQNPSCGKQFTRRRDGNGRLQPGPVFEKKRFCSPTCATVVRARENYNPTQRELDMIEDVLWIMGTDTPDRIAERVGYLNAEYLIKTLRKCQRHDLALRLEREHREYLQAGVAA